VKEDDLARQLRQADAAFGPPPVPAEGLSERAVGQWRRGRAGRRLARVAALVAIVAAAGTWYELIHRPSGRGPEGGNVPGAVRVGGIEPAAGPTEAGIRALTADADARLAVVERMTASARRQSILGAEAGATDPIETVRRQVDRAAYLMLLRADRVYGVTGRPGPAMATYRKVIRMFPQTPWAQVARQRQINLQQSTGDTL